MGFFYERTETKDKIIIKCKYLSLLYALTILALIISFVVIIYLDSWFLALALWFVCLFYIVMIIFIVLGSRKVDSEIKKAVKKNRSKVKVSGIKWSFSNPRIVEIPKELLKEEST